MGRGHVERYSCIIPYLRCTYCIGVIVLQYNTVRIFGQDLYCRPYYGVRIRPYLRRIYYWLHWYNVPMTTAKEFVAISSVIEGVGVSAYLGAAADITSKAYLTAAGSILVTEALHQSAARGAIGEIPMANVFGTPLGLNAVYTIASGFIKSCPSTNVALPVKAYPTLTLKSGLPTAPGALVDLMPKTMPSGTFYATFVFGLDIIPVKPQSMSNGMIIVKVPVMASSQSYVFLTSDNSGNVTDSTVLAGPAIIEATP